MVFDKRFRSFMSRTVKTLKFRLRWFPQEAGYSDEEGYTDINLPPPTKNISGSLILDLRKWWRHLQAKNQSVETTFQIRQFPGFGFALVSDWLSSLIGKELLWFWFCDTQLKTTLDYCRRTKTELITLTTRKK